MNDGGITRVKNHLAGVDARSSVKTCERCHPEDRDEMKELLRSNSQKKEKKSMIDTVRADHCNGLHKDDSKEEDDEEMVRGTMKRLRNEQDVQEWMQKREGPD